MHNRRSGNFFDGVGNPEHLMSCARKATLERSDPYGFVGSRVPGSEKFTPDRVPTSSPDRKLRPTPSITAQGENPSFASQIPSMDPNTRLAWTRSEFINKRTGKH